jgi:hypothetical protein
MWRSVGRIIIDVSEESILSFFRVERMRKLRTTLAITTREEPYGATSQKTTFFSHHRENFKFYILYIFREEYLNAVILNIFVGKSVQCLG